MNREHTEIRRHVEPENIEGHLIECPNEDCEGVHSILWIANTQECNYCGMRLDLYIRGRENHDEQP